MSQPSPNTADDPTQLHTPLESSPASPAINPQPKHLGEYEIYEQLGAGGMGVVYKARHTRLNRIAAIKIIRGGVSRDVTSRFEIEARAAAKLDHPGIVSIFEIGTFEDQHFLALAYIEGETLAQRIARGPLSAEEAATLMKKLCDAVAYAHAQGVIHRDLKPANILLDAEGNPHITDFGLARLESEDQNLTLDGAVMGTPGYMAPEQCAGLIDELGVTTDVYALGAVLYCALTGMPPFQAATARETMALVLEREPNSPRLLNTQIPRDLEAICLKCLQKDRKQRYASALGLQQDLTAFLEGKPITARPLGQLSRAMNFLSHENRIVPCAAVIVAAGLVLISITFVALNERHWAEQVTKVDANAIIRNLELIETITNQNQDTKLDKASAQALQMAKISAANMKFQQGMRAIGAMLYLLINTFVALISFYMAWIIWSRSPSAITALRIAIGAGLLAPLIILTLIGLAVGGRVTKTMIDIPQEILKTSLGQLSFISIVVVLASCTVALGAYRANREKFEFRSLGAKHRRKLGQTFLSARMPGTKIAAYLIMIPLTLGLGVAAVIFFIDILGTVLFPLRFEIVAPICVYMGLALLAEYQLARITIWAITQEGSLWKIITRAGTTLESTTPPKIYGITFTEAFFFEITYGFLGGRVDQELGNPRYFMVLHQNRRMQFCPQNPAAIQQGFNGEPATPHVEAKPGPFDSTMIKAKGPQ